MTPRSKVKGAYVSFDISCYIFVTYHNHTNSEKGCFCYTYKYTMMFLCMSVCFAPMSRCPYQTHFQNSILISTAAFSFRICLSFIWEPYAACHGLAHVPLWRFHDNPVWTHLRMLKKSKWTLTIFNPSLQLLQCVVLGFLYGFFFFPVFYHITGLTDC